MDWQTLCQAAGAVIVGGYAWLKLERADRQTRNTGNGFAQEVRDGLELLNDKLERIERRMESNNRRLDRVEDKVDEAEGARVQSILDARRRRNSGKGNPFS